MRFGFLKSNISLILMESIRKYYNIINRVAEGVPQNQNHAIVFIILKHPMRMMQKEEKMFIWNFWSNDICYQNRASNMSLSQPQLASLSLIQSFVSLCGPFDSHETKYRHFFSISIFFGIIRNRFETETGASVSMHSNFFVRVVELHPFLLYGRKTR